MRPIGREEVIRLCADERAQLVEALPEGDYRDLHIAGAVSIPLKELDAAHTAQLDRDRPVIVYCFDMQCDVSPRAARMLDRLGFSDVCDYEGGKMDWYASGLPVEGESAGKPTLLDVAHRNVARCGPDDDIAAVRERLGDGWRWCAVVDDDGVILGRLREREAATATGTAAAVMELGPSTYRPSVPTAELLQRMDEKGFDLAYVTSCDGRLIGTVARADLEHAEVTGRSRRHSAQRA